MNVVWKQGDSKIRWGASGRVEVCVSGEIDQVAERESEPRVLVLYGADIPSLRLAAFGADGMQVIDLPHPEGWYFYYLSTHVYFEHVVVCVSESEDYDWFFRLDCEAGTPVPVNRAY